MLKDIRNKSRSLFIKALFILIVLSFALWGTSSFTKSKNDTDVFRFGKHSISASEYQAALHDHIMRLQNITGLPISEEYIEALNVKSEVLREIIRMKLLKLAAKENSILVGNDTIIQEIRANPIFWNDKNQFDKYIFDKILSDQNLSEAKYIQSLKEELPLELMVKTLMANGQLSSNVIAEIIYKYKQQERIVDYAVINPAKIKTNFNISEEEMADFYSKNQELYKQPEARKYSYIKINEKHLSDTITISETDLRNEYELRESDYIKPETRDIHNVIFESKQEAENFANEVVEGGKFGQLIKKYNPKSYIHLKDVGRNEFPEEISRKIFSMLTGEVSQPMQTSIGWHVFRLNSISSPTALSLEEAREDIYNSLLKTRTEETLYNYINRLEDEMSAGINFGELAEKYKLKVHKEDFKTRQEILEERNFEELAESLFHLEEGKETNFIYNSEEKAYYLAKLEAIKAESVKDFSSVKANIKAELTALKQDEAAEQLAGEILEKLSSGADFARITNSKDIEFTNHKKITRLPEEEQQQLPPNILEAVFDTHKGQVIKLKAIPQGLHYIVRVNEIMTPETADPEKLENTKFELSSVIKHEIFDQYLNHLMKRYG